MIVFMGTPECALPSLAALVAAGEEMVVISQPDRPRGRGHRLEPTPVKAAAQARGLPVWQPESVNHAEVVARLQELAPEFVVVVAFGQILSPSVLAIPARGCLNIHFSLLPRYRGAAPVNWALIRGETETGITIMLMDEGLDTGPILLQQRQPILPEDDAGSLQTRLASQSAPLLLEAIAGLRCGSLLARSQDPALACYAPRLRKGDLLLEWTRPARALVNQVRGLSPYPGAFTFHRGKRLKVIRASEVELGERKGGIPGRVVEIRPREGFVVETGAEGVLVMEVQPEGARRLCCPEYLRGRGQMEVGEQLGEDGLGEAREAG